MSPSSDGTAGVLELVPYPGLRLRRSTTRMNGQKSSGTAREA